MAFQGAPIAESRKTQKLGESGHFWDFAARTENRQFSMGNGKYVTSVFRTSHCGVESDSPPQCTDPPLWRRTTVERRRTEETYRLYAECGKGS